MNVSDKLLQLARRCLGFKVFDFGLSVRSNVHIQLCLLTLGVHHPSARWQQEGTQPQRVNLKATRWSQEECTLQSRKRLAAESTSESYVYVLMEARDGSLQVLHGHQHVLDHMVLFIQFPDGFSLGELQQRDLGRDHPTKEPAKHWVVAKRDDVLGKFDQYTHEGLFCFVVFVNTNDVDGSY